MKLQELLNSLISAFERLDTSCLDSLNDGYYSYKTKYELISELQNLFENLKLRGMDSLVVKPSECKYCYPKAKVYSFHHKETDEFIIRYLIHQEDEDEFRVEECRNKQIPDGENNMPF